MQHNYKVGDHVLIAVQRNVLPAGDWFLSPAPYDMYAAVPNDPEWQEVVVSKIKTLSTQLVLQVSNLTDSDCSYWIVKTDFDKRIKPLTSAAAMVTSTIGLATSCVNCHEGFMYPVKHNVKGGRLCYSCKQIYSWKYASLDAESLK